MSFLLHSFCSVGNYIQPEKLEQRQVNNDLGDRLFANEHEIQALYGLVSLVMKL